MYSNRTIRLKYIIFAFVFLPVIVMFSGCGGEDPAPPELGTNKNPIKMFFTPSVSTGAISENASIFIDYIADETGLAVQTSIPPNYNAVIEAFGSGLADVAIMNSFGYIMAHQRHGALARMTVVRYGDKHYKGQIIARADSGIKSLSDIDGRSFAFVDQTSTSGFLFPLKILQENGVEPSSTLYARKHDDVVRMVYKGEVDAGATFYSAPSSDGEIRDARARVIDDFPDVGDAVSIIALTDDILNDPVVFSKNVPEPVVTAITNAFTSFLKTEKGREVFTAIYSVDGVVAATDSDYDGLREALAIAKLKPEDLMN